MYVEHLPVSFLGKHRRTEALLLHETSCTSYNIILKIEWWIIINMYHLIHSVLAVRTVLVEDLKQCTTYNHNQNTISSPGTMWVGIII